MISTLFWHLRWVYSEIFWRGGSKNSTGIVYLACAISIPDYAPSITTTRKHNTQLRVINEVNISEKNSTLHFLTYLCSFRYKILTISSCSSHENNAELNQSEGPFKSRIRKWTITTDSCDSSSTGSRYSLFNKQAFVELKTHLWSGLKIAKPGLREMNPASASRNRTPSNPNWYCCSFSWFEDNIKHKRVFPEPGYTLFTGLPVCPVIKWVFVRRCHKVGIRGRENTRVWYVETMFSQMVS